MFRKKARFTIEKLVDDGESPSAQYFFFNKDHILMNYSYGFADLKNKIQVTKNTTYNAYSITKTFTALAVLQLCGQGKIDLEQPIIKYLPDYPYSDDITVRQVLSHSAGIPNAVPLSWIHHAEEHSSFESKQFFAQVFKKHDRLKFHPGDKFAYTNLGYILLGYLIERVSGMKYEDYISENIIKKLNLNGNDLGFTFANYKLQARGYHNFWSFSNLILGLFIDKSEFMEKPVSKWKPFKPFYVNGAAYGGLVGTPMAFVRYIQELLKTESSLIPEEYKSLMFRENILNSHKPSGMCLSWFTGQLNGTRYYTHAGGGGGYYCEIRIYPEKGLGSVIFFNRTGMTDERFLDQLDYEYLDSGT